MDLLDVIMELAWMDADAMNKVAERLVKDFPFAADRLETALNTQFKEHLSPLWQELGP